MNARPTIRGMKGLFAQALQAETRDPGKYFFDAKLGDFKSELATARAEKKKGILLMFEWDDCPYCKRMRANILSQSEVQDYFRKNFLIYTIDTRGDVMMTDFKGRELREKDFSLENKAMATPVFIVYDLNGNQVMRKTGASRTTQEFLEFGRRAVEKLASK